MLFVYHLFFHKKHLFIFQIYLHNDTVQKTGATFPLFQEEDDPHFLEEHVHSMEEKVAHVLHKASVVILGILVVYVSVNLGVHCLKIVYYLYIRQ